MKEAPKCSICDVSEYPYLIPEENTSFAWICDTCHAASQNGVPARVARVDRLKGLGNAVVPGQAREAFRRLMGL